MGFKLLLNKKGELCTEYTGLPQDKAVQILSAEAYEAYRIAAAAFRNLHDRIQTSVQNHVDN